MQRQTGLLRLRAVARVAMLGQNRPNLPTKVDFLNRLARRFGRGSAFLSVQPCVRIDQDEPEGQTGNEKRSITISNEP